MAATCKSITFTTVKAQRAGLKQLRANAKRINAEGTMKVTVAAKRKSKTVYVAQVCARHRKRKKKAGSLSRALAGF